MWSPPYYSNSSHSDTLLLLFSSFPFIGEWMIQLNAKFPYENDFDGIRWLLCIYLKLTLRDEDKTSGNNWTSFMFYIDRISFDIRIFFPTRFVKDFKRLAWINGSFFGSLSRRKRTHRIYAINVTFESHFVIGQRQNEIVRVNSMT